MPQQAQGPADNQAHESALGQAAAALVDAAPTPYWLDRTDRPDAAPALRGEVRADLAVVGGGFSGLWTALLAKERDPQRTVVLLESRTIGWAASGRNGGFCSYSITHGLGNGLARFPTEIAQLEAMGRANLDEIESAIGRYGIDCGFRRSGELNVATAPWQLPEIAHSAQVASRLGADVSLLDATAVRHELDSPTYVGGAWDRGGCAIVDPARLAWGLREACLRLGVRVYEGTPVRSVEATGGDAGAGGSRRRGPGIGGGRLRLRTPSGEVEAEQVALATGAHSDLLRRFRAYLVPVYDYALMSEPLSRQQLTSIGWANRQGVGDAANQFHYYRLTDDDRILWGGYDAVYYNGGRIKPGYDQNPATFVKLSEHFFQTFPQLDGVRFTHKWGGVIDTCSRFTAFFDTAFKGRLAYAVGYTGLGVGATRFGAQVMLDLLGGEPTVRTQLRMVRGKPLPFPPEPLRSGAIQLTRWSIERADRAQGRRNLWLRTLDRLGLGFDT